MGKYRVVSFRQDFSDFVERYPFLIDLLYLEQNDIFETKQVELIFSSMCEEKKMLLEYFNEREDYTYFHGIHQLINCLTDEVIKVRFNEYDIEIFEENSKHIIYDLLKGFSKNFYMIRL